MSAGELLGKTIDVVEVTIGFIFELLVQLIAVELFVIELCYIVMLRMGWLTSRFSMLRVLDCGDVSMRNSQRGY